MNKEQQDFAWQCLPKGVRAEQRVFYKNAESEFGDGANYVREKLFGKHNLTSDEEPPELLFVEREKVISKYKSAEKDQKDIKSEIIKKAYSFGRKSLLKYLFGDKCLPDKEPSVQTNPNFKVGDKVKVISGDHLGEIAMITKVAYDGFCKLSDIDGFFSPIRLKLYTEPSVQIESKFKVGDLAKHNNMGKVRIQEVIHIEDEYRYSVRRYLDGFDNTFEVDESELEPYTEPETNSPKLSTQDAKLSTLENDNMEEKELNLVEFLKDCIGDTFFHPHYGDVELVDTNNGIHLKPDKGGVIIIPSTGCYPMGMTYLYPDVESMKKYPLDPYSAWMEWQSERTPKRWRAEYGETYYSLRNDFTVCDQYENNDSVNDDAWDNYNYFRTREEAQQAAEVVKECLMKFHEQN